jgi:WD40 repeat protein
LVSLIFVSHSSPDNAEAMAMGSWLATQGWGEVFLDLDPSAGLAPGQRWREELRKAGERCSAVVVLISPHWAASKWCLTEFLFAAQLGKEIFPVLIASCPFGDLPIELTGTYQFADISTPERRSEGYERLRIGLQRAGLHPDAFAWPPKDDPNRPIFRGLRVLEEKDAAILFGRDAQITQALDTIRRLRDGAPQRMLAILGASGAGKSSFLRAGILARLKRDFERFLVLPTVRPGRAALTGPTGLRRALGYDGLLDDATIAARLAELRAQAVEHSRTHTWRQTQGGSAAPPTLILPIDQAEELFVAGDEEAATAITAIVAMLRVDPNLLLLLTIRSDSFGLLQGDQRLSGVPRLPFDLPRLSSAAFKEIIEGPTRLPGARLSIDADLTEQLIRDFEGTDALPLLAFTLERLVTDHGADGRIEKQEYLGEMKGVGGAIRKAVEAAFAKAAEMPSLPRSRAALDALAQRTFLPGLVRIDDVAAAPKRRVALRRNLPQEALPLIDCLVDQRLLVTDTAGIEQTVEVSHEAVLRHWPELVVWIADRRDELSLSERVMAAARDWRAAGGSATEEALVHRGERLRTAENLLLWDDLRRQIGDDSIAYLAACREREERATAAEISQRQRQRRLRRWIGALVTTAALITMAGAAFVVRGQRNLGRAQSLTLSRTADGLAREGDYVRALRLSILAARGNGLLPTSAEGLDSLSSNAQGLNLSLEVPGVWDSVLSNDESRLLTWSLDHTVRLWNVATGAQTGPTFRHDGPVRGAVFSKDETRILTWSDDGTARLWNTATGAQIGPALRHDERVRGADFSKDEARVLTWSDDGTARLWNTASGAQIGPALKHADPITDAFFSKDEKRILTLTRQTARLWNTATGAQIGPELEEKNELLGADFSKDQKRILIWSDIGIVRLWDVATGAQFKMDLKHDDYLKGAVLSKDGKRILTWSRDGTARLWNAATGAQIGPARRHDGPVGGADFSRDESRILTWSDDGTARLWNTATGAQIRLAARHAGAVRGAVFSADETRILTWSDDTTARLWNAATGEQIGSALKHDGRVWDAVFSKDETRVLTWSVDDETARLWNVATGANAAFVLQHDNAIVGAVFFKDESRILTWSEDKTARLWNTAGRTVGLFWHGGAVKGAVVSRDESRILTWSDDGTARLWDDATGLQIGPSLRHGDSVTGAVFSKDESRILTWSKDQTARLWNAATGAQIGPTLTHGKAAIGAVFSKDEKRILTWSDDGTARLWNSATGIQIGPALKHDAEVWGAVFSNDESRILTWGKETVRLWNAATGAQIGSALAQDSGFWGAALLTDGTRILTWSFDGTARLWNTATGGQIWPALRHDGPVRGAVFSKDETRILTWSEDKTARLWNTATGVQIGPALRHDDQVRGAVFSKDETRILTWGYDKTARLWNAATGAQIGPTLKHGFYIDGAILSKDETRILTWSFDGIARLWNVRWAMRDATDSNFVADVCREKLIGASVAGRGTPSRVLFGVRSIDEGDTAAAPILRGREGQNVCDPPPTTWDTLMSFLRSPLGN